MCVPSGYLRGGLCRAQAASARLLSAARRDKKLSQAVGEMLQDFSWVGEDMLHDLLASRRYDGDTVLLREDLRALFRATSRQSVARWAEGRAGAEKDGVCYGGPSAAMAATARATENLRAGANVVTPTSATLKSAMSRGRERPLRQQRQPRPVPATRDALGAISAAKQISALQRQLATMQRRLAQRRRALLEAASS